ADRIDEACRPSPFQQRPRRHARAAAADRPEAANSYRLEKGRRVIVLSGAEVVLPDRVLSPGTVVIDDGRIIDIKSSSATAGSASNFAFHGHYIVPGFIDVHVHGVDGVDTLNGRTAVGDIASRMPRFGVTGFCPTSVACAPTELREVLEQVRRAREAPDPL